jgi:hypothetical protein
MKFIEEKEQVVNAFHLITLGGKSAKVLYALKIQIFQTEGEKKELVECAKILNDSVKIYYYAQIEKTYITLSLADVIARMPSVKGEIITSFNCHGYSLTDGKYWINSKDANKIFREEYEETELEKCDVVAFKDDNCIIHHSGKYNSKKKSITDKQGVRGLIIDNNIENILKVDDYKNLKAIYLRKKSVNKTIDYN